MACRYRLEARSFADKERHGALLAKQASDPSWLKEVAEASSASALCNGITDFVISLRIIV